MSTAAAGVARLTGSTWLRRCGMHRLQSKTCWISAASCCAIPASAATARDSSAAVAVAEWQQSLSAAAMRAVRSQSTTEHVARMPHISDPSMHLCVLWFCLQTACRGWCAYYSISDSSVDVAFCKRGQFVSVH
eukprot:GHRR01036388.1.p1 GENE.GHRR01036388.1~~GHRR01036388.1.p1  ORF type:complete len:133 (-),score=37.28 GHRR01036388.1:30-428(-)